MRDSRARKWLGWEEVLGQHGRTLRTARRAYALYGVFGVGAERVRERGRWHNAARAVALYLCRELTAESVQAPRRGKMGNYDLTPAL